ncbi:MAG: killer suppression protein HigA [Rhodospirillaceae bacterium]|nr:killer suppression protein HigA [Rhodospirillaceae bacterium]
MDITFRTRKLEKTFNSERELQKAYGKRMAERLMSRLAVLKNARTLADVPSTKPERCHPLKGRREGQYAVELVHPRRLVFKPNHDPVPEKDDGGIDLDKITSIIIVEVVDYH